MLIILRVVLLLRRLYIIMIGVYNLYYSAQVEVHYKSNHQACLFFYAWLLCCDAFSLSHLALKRAYGYEPIPPR